MSEREATVITIDGPSGSGKGTVSQHLARELGWHFLDSGALYRVLALAAQRRGVSLDAESEVAALADALDVVYEPRADGEPRIRLDGDYVGAEVRSEAAGDAASRVAVLPAVRQALLARQRAFRRPPGLVADGRDMGSVVFPDAALKIFLTASPEERAARRYKQLKEKGLDARLGALVADIRQRDERDSQRSVAPLRPADDAHVIDTTGVDAAAVVAHLRQLAQTHLSL